MWKHLSKRCTCSLAPLCLIFPVISHAQGEPRAAKKPDLVEVQLKVADKKDSSPINDADVKIMWGQGRDAGSGDSVTNSNGIARVKNVPRVTVVIRVIANGYKTVAPSVDLSKGEQPVKIEMEKETKDNGNKDREPPSSTPHGSSTVHRQS